MKNSALPFGHVANGFTPKEQRVETAIAKNPRMENRLSGEHSPQRATTTENRG